MSSSKRCSRCRETKPFTDFARNRSQKTGYSAYCKPCHNEVVRLNRLKNHGSTRSFWLKRRYGVDSVTVEWLILQQAGVCAICHKGKPEHVDHDHRTNTLRGILCFNCNRGLGKFRDDPGLMKMAVGYLKRTAPTR